MNWNDILLSVIGGASAAVTFFILHLAREYAAHLHHEHRWRKMR